MRNPVLMRLFSRRVDGISPAISAHGRCSRAKRGLAAL
jgi:hypothetical protein